MLSIFYATNAIKDIEKSLLPNKIQVSCNRIVFVLHVLKKTIRLQIQNECGNAKIFHNEILNVISFYNSTIEELNNLYNLNITKIETTS